MNMFENLIRELEQLNNSTISIPIKADEDGYYDKECPSENCLFQFKIAATDWDNKCDEKSIYCPFCGHNGKADSFFTTEQLEAGKKLVDEQVRGKLNSAIAEDTRNFNSKQSNNGFIKMKMSFSGSTSLPFILPLSAKKEFEQKIKCVKCETNYAIIGSAYFCPCCGHNSVIETFDNSINKILTKIRLIETIRKSVSEFSIDEAEITVRSLIETCLSDGVVAFQRYCDLTYKENQKEKKNFKNNSFQNLEIGNELWKDLFGESFQNWLTEIEYKQIVILFQKRHLLMHSEGIVDEKYIKNSNDTNYKVGQRIVIKENDILELVRIIKKIITKICENLSKSKNL